MTAAALRPAPTVKALEGLRLAIVRRAYTMLVLHFVQDEVKPYRDGAVGDFALHIDGPWRLQNADRNLITGRSALFCYGGPGEEPDDWRHEDGQSAQDREFGLLFELQPGPYGWKVGSGYDVTSAIHETTGDLTVSFANGVLLKAFPDGAEECWRLFVPGGADDMDHLVVPLAVEEG